MTRALLLCLTLALTACAAAEEPLVLDPVDLCIQTTITDNNGTAALTTNGQPFWPGIVFEISTWYDPSGSPYLLLEVENDTPASLNFEVDLSSFDTGSLPITVPVDEISLSALRGPPHRDFLSMTGSGRLTITRLEAAAGKGAALTAQLTARMCPETQPDDGEDGSPCLPIEARLTSEIDPGPSVSEACNARHGHRSLSDDG